MPERETKSLELIRAEPPPPDPLIGVAIGGYRISRRIGKGGMGAVYLGVHPTLGKRVAVKVILSDASHDDAARRRFLDEARAIAALDSPYIVTVHDLAELPDGRTYMMMEYLDGESLAEMVRRRGALPAPEAVAIAVQVLDGLAATHAKGIVHRDIKPGNLLIARTTGGPIRMKVLDFGVAKLTAMTAAAATRSGAIMGTAAYMSPEQASGSRSVDARSDLYSLGVVLYELVAGRLPFESADWLQLLAQHRTEPPPPLGDTATPALEAVITRALAKDPAARFADAGAMRAALVAAIGGELAAVPEPDLAEESHPTTPITRETNSAPPAEPDPSGPATGVTSRETPTRGRASAPARRGRRTWTAVVVMMLAGAAIAVVAVAVMGSAGSAGAPRTCDQGNAAACLEQGRRHDTGDGVPKDHVRAAALYDTACRGGSFAGCTALGVAARDGDGLEVDLARAIGLFERACEGGDAEACYYLGEAYDEAYDRGTGVTKDSIRSAALYDKACAGGYLRGCTDLGWAYERNAGVPLDLERAVALYRRGCNGGVGRACGYLGKLYYYGRGITKDLAVAAAAFAKGCELDSPYSCYSWGYQLVYGEGVDKDAARGTAVMQGACDDRQAQSCTSLGVIYSDGVEVPADKHRSVSLYQRGCDLGNSSGCWSLALVLGEGRGVVADPPRAAMLYVKACELGHADACASAGEVFAAGTGVTRDATRAAELAARACKLDQAQCPR